jgi:DNA repair ATPase RecN
MWPFKKKGDVETKVAELDNALTNSFQRVRDDMTNVTSWLNHLYSQEAERQQALANLQNQVWQLAARQQPVQQALPQAHGTAGVLERIKKVEEKIDQLHASVRTIEPVIDRVTSLNSNVKLVDESQQNIFERLRDISSRIDKFENIRTRASSNFSNLREKIVKKVARRSKDYIKGLLLSTIAKYDQISALQLREIIVEEQGLCSKSTFYRLLEEIESEDSVGMVSRGKEKVYMPKMAAKH